MFFIEKIKNLQQSIVRFHTIGSRVALFMSIIMLLVVILAVSIYVMNERIQKDTIHVSLNDIPTAITAIAMLDEIGDMNANVLEYTLGEPEEKEEFESNSDEFLEFLIQLRKATVINTRRVDEVDDLFNQYYIRAQAEIFNIYTPANEEWAKQRVYGLITNSGMKLEILLDDLKDSEISDAGQVKDFSEVLHDDLPGVRLYLELRDKAGDMIGALNQYIAYDPKARASFVANSQSFEEFLEQLKLIETKTDEITIRATYFRKRS